jgi:SAM-dependent methyltransferase
MTNVKGKPFYGLINFTRANLVTIILFITGIMIYLLFSFLLGIILILMGVYSLLSYIISIFLIKPTKSIDFSKMFKLKGNEIILDAGCGLGRATVGIAKLLENGKVIGIDIWDKLEVPGNSPEKAYKNAEIENVKNRVDFRFGDVFDLPFPYDYFDIVICSGLITSFHDNKKKVEAMKNIYHVLKPNGIFLMREPTLKISSLIILTPEILAMKMPSRNHWLKLLKKSGFNLIKYYPHRIAGTYKMIKV